MVTVTWAGMAIITDGAEAEGIITDGDTTTDELKLTTLRCGCRLAAALLNGAKRVAPFNPGFTIQPKNRPSNIQYPRPDIRSCAATRRR